MQTVPEAKEIGGPPLSLEEPEPPSFEESGPPSLEESGPPSFEPEPASIETLLLVEPEVLLLVESAVDDVLLLVEPAVDDADVPLLVEPALDDTEMLLLAEMLLPASMLGRGGCSNPLPPHATSDCAMTGMTMNAAATGAAARASRPNDAIRIFMFSLKQVASLSLCFSDVTCNSPGRDLFLGVSPKERAGSGRKVVNREVRFAKVGLRAAAVGVAEHGNSAVLVTIAPDGELLDRRRVDLTRDLPTHPIHHEGSWAVGRYLASPWARPISLPEAVALVERVRDAAARGARESLDALAAAVPVPIGRIAIRVCPELPPTTEERIADNRAANVADSIMYREALADAARARGWSVHWYDRDRVFQDAATALGGQDIDAFLRAMGRAIGPPWQAKHKLAAAAALAAGARR